MCAKWSPSFTSGMRGYSLWCRWGWGCDGPREGINQSAYPVPDGCNERLYACTHAGTQALPHAPCGIEEEHAAGHGVEVGLDEEEVRGGLDRHVAGARHLVYGVLWWGEWWWLTGRLSPNKCSSFRSALVPYLPDHHLGEVLDDRADGRLQLFRRA
jgi:hypothetical protein